MINELLDPEPRDPSGVEGCLKCGRANVLVLEYVHRPIDPAGENEPCAFLG